MPELPEVEMVARGLRVPLTGRRVTGLWSDWPRVMHSPEQQEFAARIDGQVFRAIDRRGKYLLCALDSETLIVHLRMTGKLYVAADEERLDADRWMHFRLQLDGGQQLRFSDARKFGRVWLTTDPGSVIGALGPEPLSRQFTSRRLRGRLAARGRAIKPLLLDQGFLAGVGNIYADEALHRARIHPLRPANSLDQAEATALHRALRAALRAGIQHEGASINWYRKPDGSSGDSQSYFRVYGRAGQPCPRCGAAVEKTVVAQRGTHFCPRCQPPP
ncbi:MAG: bifunctional DNA-formamidopyrimidine glycosylase/DNA-(apurinic or apyrimidinic site) lyase [Anaerolineaceae bacterium]|nr:bifunctional DNA-formamidopyrimidine glycosylase/DNA-(apurinic or apyrimidinic site) lyase [Anaerolineaceae bacterium]MDE0329180.1 bifunctional DNA-formamidopyrimidine glycosylase/DNA-(apurinic or apyrimidinic site) lyase [Anaerolineaceae bacterium]